MNPQVFTQADREAFARAGELMGGHAQEKLVRRLDENLMGRPGPQIDRATLDEAGRRELRWFTGGGNRVITWSRPGMFARQGVAALRSLQSVLFFPGLRDLTFTQRAGLHRLARALCDLERSEAERQLANLPTPWRECLWAALGSLIEQPKALEAAPGLRIELQIPDGSVQP